MPIPSSDTLNLYADLAAISYAPDAVKRFQVVSDYAIALKLPNALDEAYAVLSGGDLIIVIRGSDEPGDWIFRNMAGIIPTWSRTMRINLHGGFWSGCKPLIPAIWQTMKAIRHKRLIIVGHSKGGAMAHLIGFYFRNLYPLVYSYGAPRCLGTKVPFDAVNHYRIAHVYDPVPRVPPQSMGWQHYGNETVTWGVNQYDSSPNVWREAMQASGDLDTIRSLLTGRIRYHFEYGVEMRKLWVY
jgi:hypothetical protein